MNIQKQNTIDELGRIVKKDQLTHNQSFEWLSGTSVNSRVKTEKLLACMFGACIKQIMIWAMTAQQLFPNVPILASKIDFMSAFQQCHLNAATAVQICTQLVEIGILLMMLQLRFGRKPCPYEWGIISETICNLANTILHDETWDPDELSVPNHLFVREQTLLNDDILFGQGTELIVDILISPRGMHHIYMYTIINLTVNIPKPNHIAQGHAATLLAIDATAWPNHPEKPIPCKSMDTRDKLMAKAGLTKMKIILGWEFDFRCLCISLPENKFIAWMTNISTLLTQGTTTTKELGLTIGQLGHLTLVMPRVHHSLRRLQELQQLATHCHSICINETCHEDFMLMLCFLNIKKQGININLIVFWWRTYIYWSDSCPFGLRGYLDKGLAWHFEIPEDIIFRVSNNLLEYIAPIISPWVNMLAGCLNTGDCALLMMDCSTSAGWHCKTNFQDMIGEDADPVQSKVYIKPHNITPPYSSRRASRNTPGGSWEKKTMLPMLSCTTLMKLMTN
jgi:hypothetical protein